MARRSSEVADLEKRFVCVRAVQMKGVDLDLFQFEYDLTLAAVFLNAGGTIYGRYGTRDGGRNDQMGRVSLASFRKAMERALALHEKHPANAAALAGKRGPKPPVSRAEEYPELRKRADKKTDTENCIHCHMVEEHRLRERKREGRLEPSDLWSYPLPENIGLRLDRDDGLRVAGVTEGSAAARAGLAPGDDLLALEGQPLISQADVQWVLHRAPAGAARLRASYRRGGEAREAVLDVPAGWKARDKSWSDSLWALRPRLQLDPVSRRDREAARIPEGSMALRVRYAFDSAAKAGLKTGDVVVEADGRTDFPSETHLLAHLFMASPPRREVRLIVLRKQNRITVELKDL